LILSPESTIRVAKAIVAHTSPYAQTVAAARTAVAIIRDSVVQQELSLPPREQQWLEKIERALVEMPEREETLISEMAETYGHRFLPASYGL
jgi:hypothetical protein